MLTRMLKPALTRGTKTWLILVHFLTRFSPPPPYFFAGIP